MAAVQRWRRNNLLRSHVHDIPIATHDDEPAQPDQRAARRRGHSDANDTPTVADSESLRLRLDNQLKAERVAKLRTEIDILRARHMRRDLHSRAVAALIDEVQARVAAFIETIPVEFASLPTSKIRLLGRDWYDRLCAEMQGKRSIEFPAPTEGGTT